MRLLLRSYEVKRGSIGVPTLTFLRFSFVIFEIITLPERLLMLRRIIALR
jgi:hypothetical protein